MSITTWLRRLAECLPSPRLRRRRVALSGQTDALEPRIALVASIPSPDHVVIVVEENHAYEQIIGNADAPWFNALAIDPQAALFTRSYGVTHPSQPNYLHLFSGSSQGVTDNNIPASLPFTTPNLGGSLIAAGKTFVGYSDGLPSVGFNGANSGAYFRKHSPWTNWQDSPANGIPAANNRPFTDFPTDFSQLPTVAFVTPDQNHDMHDGTIAQADAWLKDNLGPYADWARSHNSLLIVTWDEDESAHGNHIPTLFFGPMVVGGQYSTTINHHNVLRTLEEMFALPHAGAAATATPITGIWSTASTATATFLRAYNPTADYHFFTTNPVEFANAVNHGYIDESAGHSGFSVYIDAVPGTRPIHRLYNLNTGRHYYTTSNGERDYLVSLSGWRFERDEGYLFPSATSGATEVFRLYNTLSGAHLYTTNAAMKDAILALTSGDSGAHPWARHSSLGYAFQVAPSSATAMPASAPVTGDYPNDIAFAAPMPLLAVSDPAPEADTASAEHPWTGITRLWRRWRPAIAR